MRLLILLLLLPMLVTAQRSKEKDVRYVWADSGLVLRAAGRAGAEKITTIPFGAEVRLTGKSGEGSFVTLYEPRKNSEGEGEAWKQRGYYLEVAYGVDTGFVHSAYLSRWSADSFEPTVDGYYRWNAKPIDTLYRHLSDNEYEHQEESFLYDSGITVTRYASSKASEGTIVLPNATFQEGFHFARKFFGLDLYSVLEPEYTQFFLISQSDNELVFRQDLLEVTITSYWGVVIITHIASC